MNYNLDTELIKKIAIYGLIFGAVVGVISVIPFITWLGLLTLMCLSSLSVLFYLVNFEKYENELNYFQSMISGAIIGFAATVGFFVLYTSIVFIINLLFDFYKNSIIGYVLKEAFWLYILIIIVFAFIFACTNAVFAAFATKIFAILKTLPAKLNTLKGKINEKNN